MPTPLNQFNQSIIQLYLPVATLLWPCRILTRRLQHQIQTQALPFLQVQRLSDRPLSSGLERCLPRPTTASLLVYEDTNLAVPESSDSEKEYQLRCIHILRSFWPFLSRYNLPTIVGLLAPGSPC